MRSVSTRRFPGASLSFLGTLGLSCLCAAAMVGLVKAQPVPVEGAAKAAPAPQEPSSPQAEAAGKNETPPQGEPAPRAKRGAKRKPDKRLRDPRWVSKKKRRARPKLRMDPNAKWICEHPVVDLGNVWSGQRKLTFGFDIRNEGTADLKVRAQGG